MNYRNDLNIVKYISRRSLALDLQLFDFSIVPSSVSRGTCLFLIVDLSSIHAYCLAPL